MKEAYARFLSEKYKMKRKKALHLFFIAVRPVHDAAF
jgi:hypothetical protein